MSELIKALATKQDTEDIINDTRSLIAAMKEYRKSIFRWMLFFAVTQTIITSAILLYFLR